MINQGCRFHEAEEIVAETMLRVYEKWSEIASPKSYARTTATRLMIEWRNRLKRGRQLEEQADWGNDDRRDQDEITSRIDNLEHVQALNQLTALQRMVLSWTLDGFTSAEIAERISAIRERKMTQATVRSVRRHARRRLEQLRSARSEEGGRP
ncbi:sigma factor [Nonomuraea sp. NPDC005650]|uniref:RNA polymerase sigma factor n=1 Tax=Nonomuraea sp. NPDC005650 TaxID=3157045 RepID=UPI0033B16567